MQLRGAGVRTQSGKLGPTLQKRGGPFPTPEVGHSGSTIEALRIPQCSTRASHRRKSLTCMCLAVAGSPQRMPDPHLGLHAAHPVAMTYKARGETLRVGQRASVPSSAPPTRAGSHMVYLGAGAGGAARTGFPRVIFSSPFAFKNGRRAFSTREHGGRSGTCSALPPAPTGPAATQAELRLVDAQMRLSPTPDPSLGQHTAHPVAMTCSTGRGFVARGATGARSEPRAALKSSLAFDSFGCRRRRGRENWLPPCYIQLPLRI